MDPNELKDCLLEAKYLYCGSCHTMLSVPTMLLEDLGNVCYPCYTNIKENDNNVVALKNISLDAILRKTSLSCKYKYNGCGEQTTYNYYHFHQTNCEYRNISCILIGKCKWEGRYKDFVDHLDEDHSEMMLSSSVNSYVITFNLEESDVIRTLQTTGGLFISRLKVSEAKLNVLIFKTDEVSNQLRYSFRIEYCENKLNTNIQQCKIVGDLIRFIEFDENMSTEVQFQNLNPASGDKFTVKLLFTAHNPYVDEALFKIIKCSVCGQCKKSGIFTCPLGHIYCNACKLTITTCNICGHTLYRNYTLTKTMEHLSFPCPHREKGCKLQYFLASGHDEACKFYDNWSCFHSECEFKGSYTKLLIHTKESCQRPLPFEETNIQSLLTSDFRTGIRYDDLIFEINFCYNKGSLKSAVWFPCSCSWYIQINCPKESNRAYFYEFTLSRIADNCHIKAFGMVTCERKELMLSLSEEFIRKKYNYNDILQHKFIISKK